ncbi:MAG: T9SS type A sorting domain-containing protein [Bacteroidetes bacterium]|nr:T9SS type A sorting domain-containing protein [Bacteroidota bacterium]
MKKLYTLIAFAGISLSLIAQSIDKSNLTFTKKTTAFPNIRSGERLMGPDTLGLVNFTDFLPEFRSINPYLYAYSFGGYVYGNNKDTMNVCAQGYSNLNNTPVRVIGVYLWFGAKHSDLSSSPSSKVVVKALGISANKAINTDSSGTFNSTVFNWPGPNTGNTLPDASADILFSNIDTIGNLNYVSFAVPPVYTDDFAVGVDFSGLAAGDTTGLVCDGINDAYNLDYAFHLKQNKWMVTDQLFSTPGGPDFGSGGFDNNIAIWAVVDTPQCYSHFTTTYDSTLNTFNLTIAPLTTAFATGYHWDFGDGSTSTLPAPTHIYTVDSLYNVCLKIYTAAGDSCEYCHIIGIDSLGNIIRNTPGFTLSVINPITASLNNIENENTIAIYPNPAADNITINFTSTSKNVSIKIYDARGRLVKSIANVKSGETNFNISELESGLYLINVNDGNTSTTKRFIKQ